MTKQKEKQEELDENLFGNFKFIDQTVPKKVNKTKEKTSETEENQEVSLTPEQIEAERKSLEEIDRIAKEKEAKKKEKAKEIEETEVDTPSTIEEKEEKEETEDTESVLQVFATGLRDQGILDIEDTSQIKSEDDLYEVVAKTVKNGIEGYKSSKPQEVQEFLDYVENGGKPSDFHKYYYNSEVSFEEFKMESDEDREYIIREGLALEEYTEEEIEEELNDLKDLGKLEKKSEIILKKLQKYEKDQKKLLIESQKEYAKKEEERRASEWAEFKKGLFEKDEICGFKFTEKMKNDTWNYMTKIVDKKNGLTQYQIEGNSNDPRYLFAFLQMNKWNKDSLESQVKTKAVSKLTSKLGNYSDNRSKMKSGTTIPDKSKDETNPFSNFKAAL